MGRNTRIFRFRLGSGSSESTAAAPPVRISALAFVFILACGSAFGYTLSGTTYTTDGSVSDVQSAINAAPNGSTVVIPNGSYAWSAGITCGKVITIQGASAGGVTITDNFSGTVVDLTPQSSGDLTFANLNFTEGSVGAENAQHFIVVEDAGLGTQPVLIHDCQFSSVANVLSHILWSQNGGVIWNCTFNGGNTGINITNVNIGIQFKDPSTDRWGRADSMGLSGDPNGTLDTYVENCTFNGFYTAATDCDDGSRTVIRYCTFNTSVCGSHGYDTSPFGNRHWEIYNNTYIYPWSTGDVNAPNMNTFIIMRGGTGVITGNSFCPTNTTNWGSHTSIGWLLDGVTQIRCFTTYPIPRALGQGWNGGSGTYSESESWGSGWSTLTGYFTDPIYVWGNRTNNTYQSGSADTYRYMNNTGCDNGYTTQDFVIANRDFYFDNGAKPGWSAYTYPHPLRASAIVSGSPTPTPTPNSTPPAPQNLRVLTP